MTEILQNLLAQGPMLIVVVGSFALVWRALGIAHDLSTLALQKPTAQPPVKPSAPTTSPSSLNDSARAAVQTATVAGPFDGAPKWFQAAVHEIGFHETGNNQGISRYIGMAHCGAEGDPWCAIFANAMLETSGVAGSRSASSQSFRTNPNFVQLSGPALGALAVFWRGSSPDSGMGHVGFYRGEDATRVWTLGGNENDMVQIEALPKQSSSFGLIGYWWPKAVPLPTMGPVLMPTSSPVSIQTGGNPAASSQPGKQTRIIATMFGGQQSAYGGAIDDAKPGVALPFRFAGTRPQVRVTGLSSGASVVCDIVDVGPWNTADPYWETGKRPDAESGRDTRARRTNGAGIDLTFAAAKAIGIDGKGLVDWEFELFDQPKTT